MFLVDYDYSRIGKWCKKSRSRAYDDIYIARPCSLHLIKFLARRHRGIDYGYPVSKVPVKAHKRLIGKRNLRDKNYRLSAFFYYGIYKCYVNFRLTASCYPVDQVSFSFALVIITYHAVYNVLLLVT